MPFSRDPRCLRAQNTGIPICSRSDPGLWCRRATWREAASSFCRSSPRTHVCQRRRRRRIRRCNSGRSLLSTLLNSPRSGCKEGFLPATRDLGTQALRALLREPLQSQARRADSHTQLGLLQRVSRHRNKWDSSVRASNKRINELFAKRSLPALDYSSLVRHPRPSPTPASLLSVSPHFHPPSAISDVSPQTSERRRRYEPIGPIKQHRKRNVTAFLAFLCVCRRRLLLI